MYMPLTILIPRLFHLAKLFDLRQSYFIFLMNIGSSSHSFLG